MHTHLFLASLQAGRGFGFLLQNGGRLFRDIGNQLFIIKDQGLVQNAQALLQPLEMV